MTPGASGVGGSVRILAVVGSLNPGSSNAALAAAAGPSVVEAPSIGLLPHFDPSLPEPPTVAAWRAAVAGADAVLIAAPEYAHSLPGVLKNALDWLVGTGELYEKPVAVLAATPRHGGGALGRQALVQTLRAQGADIRHDASILVRHGSGIDAAAEAAVAHAVAALGGCLRSGGSDPIVAAD